MSPAVRSVDDGFGRVKAYRRCSCCQCWKVQRIGNFSPRKRDVTTRRVLRWDAYCRQCRAARQRDYYRRTPPEVTTERNRRAWQAKKADARALEEKRRQSRDAQRRKRSRDPEGEREVQRRYRERVRADPVRNAAFLETRRLAYHMRRDRNGLMRMVAEGVPGGPMLPSAPVAAFVDFLIARAGTDAKLGDDPTGAVCAQLGINARRLLAWRTGESPTARFDVVDKIFTRGQALWFDVYDPVAHPEVERAFVG